MHLNLRGAVLTFLLLVDGHRFITKLQDFLDPSGHLLVYGCAMLALAPLLHWFIPTALATKRDAAPKLLTGKDTTLPGDAGARTQAEAEEGLAFAAGILACLCAVAVCYFSFTTAAFFHPAPDTFVTAVCIALAAGLIDFLGRWATPWHTAENAVLAVWLVLKLAGLYVACTHVLPGLARPLALAGWHLRSVGGVPHPPIKLPAAGMGLGYDVLVLGLYLFHLRAPPASPASKAKHH